jgi:carboxypeptidase Taq
LQDIHWPSGSFGYFPTYTMGALAAAQLYAAAARQDTSIRPAIAQGNFAPLLTWLKVKVHGRGSLDPSTDALLVHATGEPLGVAAFEAHLSARYLAA